MGGTVKAKAIVHVIFTATGIPRWFGPEAVPGSEPLDLEDLRPLLPEGTAEDGLAALWRDILITHRRIEGRWSVRVPEPAGDPAGDPADDPAGDSGGEIGESPVAEANPEPEPVQARPGLQPWVAENCAGVQEVA